MKSACDDVYTALRTVLAHSKCSIDASLCLFYMQRWVCSEHALMWSLPEDQRKPCCLWQSFSNYQQYLKICLPAFLPLFIYLFLWPYLQHMEVPKAGVELELQLLAYTTTTAAQDLSCLCDLHHSSRQHRTLNPLSEARD